MSSPTATTVPVGYSSTVRMHLVTGEQRLSVAQVGPDFIVLETSVEHPPMVAELVVAIDGNEKRRRVLLPQGIRVGDIETRISAT